MKSVSFKNVPSRTPLPANNADCRYFEERRKIVVVNGCISSKSELVEVRDKDRFAGQTIDDYMLANVIESGALDEKVLKPLMPSGLKLFDTIVDMSDEFKE